VIQPLLKVHSFSENIELNLFSYFKKFYSFGCTYLYYTITDLNKNRLRFTTDENWIELYLEEKLVMFDPVKIACESKFSNRVFSWKNLPILDVK